MDSGEDSEDDSSSYPDSDSDSGSGNYISSNPRPLSHPYSDSDQTDTTLESAGLTSDSTSSISSSTSNSSSTNSSRNSDHAQDEDSYQSDSDENGKDNYCGGNYYNSDLITEIEGEHVHSWQAVTKAIAEGQKHNIRHDAAEVAKGSVPFQNEDELHTFLAAFRASLNSAEYPAGFGLDSQYESSESYKTGRSRHSLVIPLPHNVWFPRIVVWCKALDLLKLSLALAGL